MRTQHQSANLLIITLIKTWQPINDYIPTKYQSGNPMIT